MSNIAIQKCGLKFKPPALILIYRTDDMKTRKRCVNLPFMNKECSISEAHDCLFKLEQHNQFVKLVADSQINRLLYLLREHLKGKTINEALESYKNIESIDPNENLNRLDEETLFLKKAVMADTFKKNQKTPDDPDFEYDLSVSFDDQNVIETCDWDSDTADF